MKESTTFSVHINFLIFILLGTCKLKKHLNFYCLQIQTLKLYKMVNYLNIKINSKIP